MRLQLTSENVESMTESKSRLVPLLFDFTNEGSNRSSCGGARLDILYIAVRRVTSVRGSSSTELADDILQASVQL